MTQTTRVLATSHAFCDEFKRCCTEFGSLHIAVAWCSDPISVGIFDSLAGFRQSLTATIGVALFHTHPAAIEWFRDHGANVRVIRDEILFFHPKVYLFSSLEKYAAFVGSSNLTHGGFHSNAEVNTLIKGSIKRGEYVGLDRLEQTLARWHSSEYSFVPSDEWLDDYRTRYDATISNATSVSVPTPPMHEQAATSSTWLTQAEWPVYYARILERLRQSGRTAEEYHDVLDLSSSKLAVPWSVEYLDDLEKRKIMGGMRPYGWLGHVAATGSLRRLLAKGATADKRLLVGAINRIAVLSHPIRWDLLEAELNALSTLGFTMKVWSRFLCIVRPDLFCTVASDSLRRNHAKTLGVAQSAFTDPTGYVRLVELIHKSPWFLSQNPPDPREAAVWRRRVAFMDAIFY